MITPDKTELWRDDIVLFRVKNKNTTHYKARPRGSKIVEKVRIPKKQYIRLWRQYVIDEVLAK